MVAVAVVALAVGAAVAVVAVTATAAVVAVAAADGGGGDDEDGARSSGEFVKVRVGSVRRLACHDWPAVASRGVRVGVRWRVGEGSRGGESGVVIGRRVGEPPARAHRDRQSAPSIQAEHIEPSESGRDTQHAPRNVTTGTMAVRRVHRQQQQQEQQQRRHRRRGAVFVARVLHIYLHTESKQHLQQDRALAKASWPPSCGYVARGLCA